VPPPAAHAHSSSTRPYCYPRKQQSSGESYWGDAQGCEKHEAVLEVWGHAIPATDCTRCKTFPESGRSNHFTTKKVYQMTSLEQEAFPFFIGLAKRSSHSNMLGEVLRPRKVHQPSFSRRGLCSMAWLPSHVSQRLGFGSGTLN
jgi:hypothetical protein